MKKTNLAARAHNTGPEMHRLMAALYPICRSITGQGVRETLDGLKKFVPLSVHEISSGTQVFDWTVPPEWNIRDAYIKNSRGEKIIDFGQHNLHVLNYSRPVQQKLTLTELKPHLFTLPDHPDWIPYRTSYYHENWGFCLTHRQFETLKDDLYEVFIDSTLEPGCLNYGELLLPGETEAEVLISTHVCHPSLCNDNLSGIVISTFLARILSKINRHYSYRFVFLPGTIGSICWLHSNEDRVRLIEHGLVISGVGNAGAFTYKKSRRGDTMIDRVAEYILQPQASANHLIEFSPYGYDERQYNSPGFNLPVGCLMRTPFNQYPEYHTSADNLDFVSPEKLEESLGLLLEIVKVLEHDRIYLNLNPKCEPQLGKRDLYHHIGGHENSNHFQMAILWVLNLSDGSNSLLDIAQRSGVPFALLKEAGELLMQHHLLEEKTRSQPANKIK